MMDIFFQDPSEIPLPPEEVRIRDFQATPWNDYRRVKVYLEVDPFQKRPSAQVQIFDQAGDVVAEVSVVETITRKMEFNMHLRHANLTGKYQIQAVLYYQSLPSGEESSAETPPELPEKMVVDQKQTSFNIPV